MTTANTADMKFYERLYRSSMTHEERTEYLKQRKLNSSSSSAEQQQQQQRKRSRKDEHLGQKVYNQDAEHLPDEMRDFIPASSLDARRPKRSRDDGGAVVKNRTAAPIQITAEHLLREAFERQQEDTGPAPKQLIMDREELEEWRLQQRRKFEDTIRRNRENVGSYINYAVFEEKQQQFDRARSVYERAIDADATNVSLWVRYAEMEMRNKFVNHARNVWERAVALLPRVDAMWMKYTHMEEVLGNVDNARQIFERWMEWMPEAAAWKAYVKFEMRYNEVDNARRVLDQFVRLHPTVESWLYYARFEQRHGDVEHARTVYERSMQELREDLARDERLYTSFAKFEEQNNEVERARSIYRYALDHIVTDPESAQELYTRFISFEKQHGDREGIEDVIVAKRRMQYEQQLKEESLNYDIWFDYIRLEESHGDMDRIREVYERSIANVPPVQEKRYWRRYIYLWINYALYEEMGSKDIERAREVYKGVMNLVPHRIFSFSKLWIMYARFELRQKDLKAVRRILGHAIGMAPKPKIFQEYIKIEILLGEMDRVRKLYEKYLEYNPANCQAWRQYAELETKFEEYDRARALFELAVAQPAIDMPELIWKSYIDFEIECNQHSAARKLYERLLDKTKHAKVWISFATFEVTVAKDTDRAREIYERGNRYFKSGSVDMSTDDEDLEQSQEQRNEQRDTLLQSWRDFERVHGTPDSLEQVQSKLPRKIPRKRKITDDDGSLLGYEDYTEYVFPEDREPKKQNLKILEMAMKWKQQQQQQMDDGDADE